MSKNLNHLIQEATAKSIDPRLEKFAKLQNETLSDDNREEILSQLEDVEEFLYAQFTGRTFDGKEAGNLPKLDFTEAVNTSDVSIVFPRVISTILQEPKAPNLFLTNNVADTIRLADTSPLSVEFPMVGALQAFDMAEGQEYSRQTLAFQQHNTSIRIGKAGVAASLTEELIKQSQWNLIDLHLRAMTAAIDRKVETRLFQTLTEKAQTVFDNQHATSEYHTTGKKVSGSAEVANYSFSYFDLVKMCGVLLQNRYEATHFLAHPLTWPIFAQDPILRAQFYHGGQLGAGIWTRMPQYDQQAALPFGISYVPYYALPFSENTTLTGVASGQGATPIVSDLYLIDQKNSLFLATRGDTEMFDMDDWFRDGVMMKARKYYGVSAKDQGRGMVAAKNVRIVPNEQALFTIREVNS